jgi:tetratricopeptide (TPR) repeat protein
MRFFALTVLLTSILADGEARAAIADGRAAEILSIQGRAEYRIDEGGKWVDATSQQPLYGGNWIRTGDLSRIAVMFVDETQVRLNQNTTLEVKQVNPPGKFGQSVLRVLLGRMWARTKAVPTNLAITTPSATAGIRGTDWELDVEDSGRSTVAVFSGEVEFYNDQGRVTVGPNEAAVAEVGKAPTKIILTNFKDRVQWVTAYAVDPLRYITLSSTNIESLKQDAASTGDSAEQRVKRGAALADLNRWAEAEKEFTAAYAMGNHSVQTLTGLSLAALRNGDRKAAQSWLDAAIKEAPRGELVRLDQAAVEINAEDFKSGMSTLQSVIRSNDAKQAAAWLILADFRVFFGEAAQAEDILREAIKRFPDDPRPYAELARAFLFADRIADGKTEVDRAIAKDPNSYLARIARGDLARLEGIGPQAEKSYREAIKLNPADDRGYFGLGQVNSEREEVKAGRANLGEALSINPSGPGYRGELGSLDTFANYLDLAEAEFNAALKTNPADYIALTGRGIELLKRGQPEAALESFNKASLMEPRYARVHVFSAVAYYQLGRARRALESLKRASELDAKDPLPYFMASMIHYDYFEPAEALAAGREALRLLPNLKSLNQVANNQKGSANLGSALAFFGMEEWAQSYAQESYYPYWAGSHLFLSDRYTPGFNKNSELYQGFITDPTVFGASNRFQELVPKPGNYQQVQALVGSSKASKFFDPEITLNGYANNGTPMAYFFDTDDMRVFKGSNSLATNGERVTGTLGLGIRPTYELSLFAYGDTSYAHERAYNVDPLVGPEDTHLRDYRADIGASYKFSPTSQLWVKVGNGSSQVNTMTEIVTSALAGSLENFNNNLDNTDYALRHTMTLPSLMEITWGIEGATQRNPVDFRTLQPNNPLSFIYTNQVTGYTSTDAYVSVRQPFAQSLLLEGDLFYQHNHEHNYYTFGFSDMNGNEVPVSFATKDGTLGGDRVAPRAGMVYRFGPNQLVRLAYQDWTEPAAVATLAPVATAGIPIDDTLVEPGGRLKRSAAQVEWELSYSTFMRALIDYREVANPRFNAPPISLPAVPDLTKLRAQSVLYTPNNDVLEGTPIFGQGTASRAAIALNQILSSNWSLLARYEHTDSKNTAPAFSGNLIPYLPRNLFTLGATWVSSARFYVTTQAVYRSERFSDEANLLPMSPGWDAQIKGYWETPDKRFSVQFVVENIFKSQTSTYYGIGLAYRH